jgi:adenosylmethionine-8-amino-7-oxononanoate aminotransferase
MVSFRCIRINILKLPGLGLMVLFCRMTITEKDRKYIWHPFTAQKSMKDPIAIVKGERSLLFDENGKSYIDAISSWWVTIHGHANPVIAEALHQQALQLEQVIFAGFTHQPAVELAEKLINILPGSFEKIFYSDNGSTSTEVALKMAIQFWWNNENTSRKKIIAFHDSYHGDTIGAMSVSERSVFTTPFKDYLIDVEFIDVPSEKNIVSLIEKIKTEGKSIAAFIYEPLVQGAGGMKMYDAKYLDQLLHAMKQQEIICIADEVMTGFGRTGKLFASMYMEEMPDIICLSKGLTGGTMALGVTACTKKIYNAFLSDNKYKTFFHGHSFTANPLACAVANASLELLLHDSTTKQIENIIAFNRKAIAEISQSQMIKDCRMLGTIIAFEINTGNDEYLNNIGEAVTTFVMNEGVYLRPLGNTVYWMPPYCITNDELEKMLQVVKAFLATITVAPSAI